ncbi:hypothetical protein BD410DRAFT_293180 [Rickenella mellea]|uniref:Uncharacterized protein n=1 Tax=Rickenella mellea TaxID=50990 RepID=A0A4Y7Q1H0_9AGAM|nr:hypothetical protein BD410DRAFT_293180 [Rickenella mellea]
MDLNALTHRFGRTMHLYYTFHTHSHPCIPHRRIGIPFGTTSSVMIKRSHLSSSHQCSVRIPCIPIASSLITSKPIIILFLFDSLMSTSSLPTRQTQSISYVGGRDTFSLWESMEYVDYSNTRTEDSAMTCCNTCLSVGKAVCERPNTSLFHEISLTSIGTHV